MENNFLVKLESERLNLREWKESDVVDYYNIYINQDVENA